MRETITISVPEEIKAELDKVVRDEGISRSDIVRESLRDYLFMCRFRLLRAEGKMTVYALAKYLGRHYKNVHTDVARLIEIGLIEKTKDGKVSVPWDVIAAELKLAA